MTNENKIIAYKGFDKDFKCRDFQYKVGETYKMDGYIKSCRRGFHACESPMEVFDYYDMLTSRFAVVEQSGKIDKEEGSTKVCSSCIKIKEEIKIVDIIELGVEWLKKITASSKTKVNNFSIDGDDAQIVSLDECGQTVSLDDCCQIGSSGNNVKIGSSGDFNRISSLGGNTLIGSSGDYNRIASSGYGCQIGSSGDYTRICSSGDCTLIASSGKYAEITSSNFNSKIGSSGYSAKICSSGYTAHICSTGFSAQIASSGDEAKIYSSGRNTQIVSAGNFAKIVSRGRNSVVICRGCGSIVKAALGSWITLSEWGMVDDEWKLVCVKTEQVDGKRIKADTYYKLIDGEFEEVE